MASQDISPSSMLFSMITGYHVSQAVYVAAKLGLADVIVDGPRSCAELAAATSTHAPSLNRVLRLLVSADVFTEDEQGRFGLSPIGECLRSGVPNSMRAAALLWGGRPQLAWSRLLQCVQTGKPAFSRIFGRDPFSYMSEHHDDADIFDKGMAALTRNTARTVAVGYDFSQFSTVIDIGGGNGTLLAGILDAHSSLHGVLFDLPHVVERASELLASLGLSDRCNLASGSFLEKVPEGGDAYILSNVITDWDDDRAKTILRNCNAAMKPQSKVLIFEAIYPARIDQSPRSRAATSTDVNVMVCTGGRERTEQEFNELYKAAGLKLTRTIPTSSRVSVIEGIRA